MSYFTVQMYYNDKALLLWTFALSKAIDSSIYSNMISLINIMTFICLSTLSGFCKTLTNNIISLSHNNINNQYSVKKRLIIYTVNITMVALY